jgi:hypothetical protein
MDIKDLVGLEKPTTKLIEVVSDAVGVVYTDTIGVNAEVRRKLKIAEAEQKIQLMKSDTDNEIVIRTQQRLAVQEVKRQINIEEIVSGAVEHLPESVTDEKPTEEWTAAFFNIAQDISSEEIQILWSKILAGEVSKPGSYSMRTLDTLKMLSKNEAETFIKLNSFVFGNYVVFKLGSDTSTLNPFGFTYAQWKLMHEAGLVNPEETLRIIVRTPTSVFVNGGKSVRFTSDIDKEMPLQIKQLTATGSELSRIIDVPPNEKYLEALKEHYTKQDVIVEIT